MNKRQHIIKTMSRGSKNIYKRLRKISARRQFLFFIAIVTGTTLGIVLNQLVICLSITLSIAIALVLTNDNDNI